MVINLLGVTMSFFHFHKIRVPDKRRPALERSVFVERAAVPTSGGRRSVFVERAAVPVGAAASSAR